VPQKLQPLNFGSVARPRLGTFLTGERSMPAVRIFGEEELFMAQAQRIPQDPTDPSTSVDQLKSELSNLASTVQRLASEQFGGAAGAVQEQATQKVNDLEAAIRRNPTQAAAIAAGVGFLVGLILRR
jgi:ElaB/YqjD/DUF883 family membrane-anchored ribosome-binding protein